MTSAFSKSSVFAVHTNTPSRRFQIHPHRFSVDGRPYPQEKSCVFKFIRLSVDVALERCPAYREFKYTKMTEKGHAGINTSCLSYRGVSLTEVSVLQTCPSHRGVLVLQRCLLRERVYSMCNCFSSPWSTDFVCRNSVSLSL